LVRRGAADFLDEQGVDAAVGIVTREARQPLSITSGCRQWERGLGHVGGDDHFALAIPRHRRVPWSAAATRRATQQDKSLGRGTLPDGVEGFGQSLNRRA
jgi:hypothetical protein